MKKLILCAAAAVTVAACAKSPESIAPAYTSPLVYRGLDCGQLGMEMARVDTALAQVSQQQRDARTGDVVGVILLGLPVSTLSGDNVADQVARLKGEKETLTRVSNENRCQVVAASHGQAPSAAAQ